MARKREITGKAVIYTEGGTKIVDAEVRRYFNVNGEGLTSKFDTNEKYMLIAQARTIPTDNNYAAVPCPEAITAAEKYTRTKFFRLMLDLMRLAQFDPIKSFNLCIMRREFDNMSINKKFPPKNKDRYEWQKIHFDWLASVEDLDAQFYRRFDFTPEMIQFTEEHYHDARQ
ncbi:MAG: hypothetical protein IKO74_02625 [Selenomonadaceae bacterium]|nr:hypothetical protein [Selenomonadaceae bacterium]